MRESFFFPHPEKFELVCACYYQFKQRNCISWYLNIGFHHNMIPLRNDQLNINNHIELWSLSHPEHICCKPHRQCHYQSAISWIQTVCFLFFFTGQSAREKVDGKGGTVWCLARRLAHQARAEPGSTFPLLTALSSGCSLVLGSSSALSTVGAISGQR